MHERKETRLAPSQERKRNNRQQMTPTTQVIIFIQTVRYYYPFVEEQ